MKKILWNIIFIVSCWLGIFACLFSLATAQEGEQERDKVKLKGTQIVGDKPEKYMRLGSTEILGRVEAPQIEFELPWENPAFVNLSALNPDRSFENEIFGHYSGMRFFEYRNRLLKFQRENGDDGQ